MTAVAKLPSLSADLLALIGSYGLARTDGVSDVERLHRWEQLVAGIKQYAADSLAAASPAELGGVVAWCQADDPLSRTAFSWPGTARNPAHTTPLYAAPQPAQAGASGGGVPVGEFQDWFEAWAKEKEEIILHRIADGRLISPTASIAESAFLAGCMTASMYYMELCRNDSTAATQPSEAHTRDFMDGLDDCPACKLGQSTCGYHTRNPATPPAHGDGEGE